MKRAAIPEGNSPNDLMFDMSTSYPHEKLPQHSSRGQQQDLKMPAKVSSSSSQSRGSLKKAPPNSRFSLYPKLLKNRPQHPQHAPVPIGLGGATTDDETKSTLSDSCSYTVNSSVKQQQQAPRQEMADHSSATQLRSGSGDRAATPMDDGSVSVHHLLADELEAAASLNHSGHSSAWYGDGESSAASSRRQRDAYHHASYAEGFGPSHRYATEDHHQRRRHDDDDASSRYSERESRSYRRSRSYAEPPRGGGYDHYHHRGEQRGQRRYHELQEPTSRGYGRRSYPEDRSSYEHARRHPEAQFEEERRYQQQSYHRAAKSEPYLNYHHDHDRSVGSISSSDIRDHERRGGGGRDYHHLRHHRQEAEERPMYHSPMDMYNTRSQNNDRSNRSSRSHRIRADEGSYHRGDPYHRREPQDRGYHALHHEQQRERRSHHSRHSAMAADSRRGNYSRSKSYEEDRRSNRRVPSEGVRRYHSDEYNRRDGYYQHYNPEENTHPRDAYDMNSREGSHHSNELRVELQRNKQQSFVDEFGDCKKKGAETPVGNLKKAPCSPGEEGEKGEVFLEVAPGVQAKLRGSHETKDAIAAKFYTPTVCWGCCAGLYCISDAAFLICPNCTTISPLDDDSKIPGAHGIGMAFSEDMLHKVQKELRNEDRTAATTKMSSSSAARWSASS